MTKPLGRPVPKAAMKATTAAPAPVAKHRLPGMTQEKPVVAPAPSQEDALDDLLGAIGQNATEKPKKGVKPVVTLDGKAAELLELQRCKIEEKNIESRIRQLEGELLPEIEVRRVAINVAKREYIGSIYATATGEDEEGNPIDPGQVLYYVQRRHSAFNPKAPSKDDDIQKLYKGKATVQDEAIEAIMAKFASEGNDVDRETAAAMLKERMEVENNVSLMEGALKDPAAIAILKQHLAKWLVADTKMSPTDGFSERANYNHDDILVMQALNDIGLCKRAKAAIKPSGAPDASD